MIVWVLIITTFGSSGYGAPSTTVIDNIATAKSCEQLANVVRQNKQISATCAPVRKAVPAGKGG